MAAVVEEQVRSFTLADPGRVAALVRGEPQKIRSGKAEVLGDDQVAGAEAKGLTVAQCEAAEVALRATKIVPPEVKGAGCVSSGVDG